MSTASADLASDAEFRARLRANCTGTEVTFEAEQKSRGEAAIETNKHINKKHIVKKVVRE